MLIFQFVVFALGLCVGSFLNVLIDRLPRGESIIKGRSHCEKCKKKLGIFDLIPVLSFVLLRGRCRYCSSKISFYYPLVELTTGLLFVLTFFNNFQFSILNSQFIFQLFIVSSLIVIFFTDLKYGIIPDKIIYPSVVVSLVYIFIFHSSLLLIHFLSAFGASLFFFLLFLITRGRGMGFGDVKLAFLLGIFLGFPKIIISLYAAFLTGAIVSIILVIWGKKKLKGGTIPFGPFLVLGTFMALFAGEDILKIIYSVLHL